MRSSSLPSFTLPFVLGFSAAAILALAPLARGAEEQLVPANMNAKQDSQGYQWDITANGAINDGSNDCFDTGMALQANGFNVNFPNPMMTADNSEYVLTGRIGALTVKRRIRLDSTRAFIRYLEIIENVGSQAQQVNLTIRSELGGNCRTVVTDGGTPYSGSLGKDDVGILALQQPGQRPSVLWLLAAKTSKLKPTISVQSNRTFQMSYSLEVKPKASAAILYYVAQRRNANSGNAAQLFADMIKKGKLLDTQLSPPVRKLVANFNLGGATTAEEAPVTAVLQPVQDLLEGSGVTRGKDDLLVFGDAGKISGNITGDNLQVETAYGKATIPLAEVAALNGGAGVQRPVQVYLRSGEVLTGSVKADHLMLTTEAGWKAAIKPEEVNLLAMRVDAKDGAEPPDSGGLLQTDAGDRIALAAGQNCPVEAATPWGNLQTSLDQISRIAYVREPYPSQRITLNDKTQVFGILRGGDLTLNTLRFGTVKVPPQAIRNLRRGGDTSSKKETPAENSPAAENGDSAEAAPASSRESVCQLVGENLLTGTIDLPEFHLDTNMGVTALDPKVLRSVQRADNSKEGEPSFTVKMANGDELTGQIEERILPIRAGQKLWRVPLIHLVSATNPEPPKAPEKQQPAESPAPPASAASPAAEPKP